MTRRHFLEHLVGASAMAVPAFTLTHSLRLHADELKRNHKAAILLWMGGGPSTIDLWDLKPGQPTGGPFRPVSTSADVQICEHLPQLARQMHHLSVVRSMSTQEADHGRGRYFMHTGYVPNPTVEHPGYGSVIANQLTAARSELEIPPFVSVGGSSVGPGFLGMAWAPFVVDSDGEIRNVKTDLDLQRLARRMDALRLIETSFVRQQRGQAAEDHAKVLDKTFRLMTSPQMDAFKVRQEPAEVQQRYGRNGFGRGCLMARRLIETGVPFVEVDLGGWDNHSNIFPILQNDRLPVMDQAMSALVEDLEQRGRLADTVVVWMGEFGRTPRINGSGGRDHWARAWSVVLGGAGMKGGIAVGQTNQDGTQVETEPYSSQDIMATVCHALGISLETTFTSRNGRPMKIANGGKIVTELFS
jgi:uncharacterized protein (DUF1501 family)